MKRLTLRKLKEVELKITKLMREKYKPGSITRVVRWVGPNYEYFTDGIMIKVFFDTKTYLGEILFPKDKYNYVELKLLETILIDIEKMEKVI